MNDFAEKLKSWAPVFLRLGLAAVFLVFGLQKLSFPSQGTAEIQQIFTSVAGEQLLSLGAASAMNYYMGLFELMLGISLAAGWAIRWAAPLSGLMVLGIFASITLKYGFNTEDETLLLDAGLIGAALALWVLTYNKQQTTDNLQQTTENKFAAWAPMMIRVGLALSLLLSGYQKVVGDGFLIGCVELVFAVFLLGGFLIRFVAPLFVLLTIWNLFAAIAERGLFVQGILPDPTLTRDIGVIGAALALWALGAGRFSIDRWNKESRIMNQISHS